jgi:hypothetical protein
MNPENEETNATLTFMLPDGSTKEKSIKLKPFSRGTIHVDNEPNLSNTSFSTKITASKPIVAERATYFNYKGSNDGNVTIGATQAAKTWYLPEGCTVNQGPGLCFDTYILLMNPDESQEANVTLTFMLPDGSTKEKQMTLKPNSRETIYVDNESGLENTSVATKVTSTNPIVVERAMYFNYFGRDGGHCTIGVASASN